MPGTVIKFDAAPIRPPESEGAIIAEDVIFCPCDYRCDFEEKVFASENENLIEQDFTDFLFKKITAADTIIIKLVKNGRVVATINDSTYGEYYDGFTNQPLYVGWQANWSAIFTAFSGGRYQIQVTSTILGQVSTFTSRYFKLNKFDILEADRTVKIRTFQNGLIDSSEFDFTELLPGGWPTSIRLSGTFGEMQPELERDVFQDSSYREIQNRDTVQREYRLKANLVPETIQNRIATKDILANQVFITSYNVLQERKYENYPVVPESFSDTRFDGLGRTYFDIIFTDRQKNIIKTNVS